MTIYSQDQHHYPDEHLTRYLDENEFDVVGVSVIAGYYQYRKLLKLSEAINASSRRPFYIIGGHGPSPEPEYFMAKTGADAIAIGEGEATALELMDAIAGKRPFASVQGIAFRDADTCVVTERCPLIDDVDSIPTPAYDLFPMEYYRLIRMAHVGIGNSDFAMPAVSKRPLRSESVLGSTFSSAAWETTRRH